MGRRGHLAMSNVTDGETEVVRICRRARREPAAGPETQAPVLGEALSVWRVSLTTHAVSRA